MKQSLIEGKISTQLIKLTLPMIWGVFSVIAFSVVDIFYVAQLGTQPLAAMSFTFPVVMTFGSLAMGLGIGASSVIARAIGKGNFLLVKRLTTNSLTLSLSVVVIFVLLGLFTIDPLFKILGAEEELLPLIHSYMEIWYWGMICLVVPMVGNNAIRSSGNTFVPSVIMTIAAVVNIVLDPILIFGLFGFPRLELAGAAIATVISRLVTLVASLWFLHYRLKMLYFQSQSLKSTVQSWGSILQIGLPAAITNMINPISIGVITGLVAQYGATAVAGFGIASKIESFALIVLMALAGSLSPFIGQNWGAKKYGRVNQALKQSVIFSLFWGALTALILWVTGEKIAYLFDSNLEVIAIVNNYLKIVSISYGAYGIIFITSSSFNALGKPLPSVTITLIKMFILYIPLAYLGGKIFEISGIFAAGTVANLLVGLGSYLWIIKVCHKYKKDSSIEMLKTYPKAKQNEQETKNIATQETL
jgi:putative MATE family efflux protein